MKLTLQPSNNMINIFATLIFMAASALMGAGVTEDKYIKACVHGPIIIDLARIDLDMPYKPTIMNPEPDYKIFTCTDLDSSILTEK